MANIQVKDYVATVNQYVADIGTDADDIDGDVTRALAKIQALEDSQGQVTDADQALITESLNMLTALKAKTAALNARTAPDAVPTPPTV